MTPTTALTPKAAIAAPSTTVSVLGSITLVSMAPGYESSARRGRQIRVDNGLGRQSIVGGGSIYPFGHNILLAARNEGLGGVLTSVLARQEPAVKELIGIPEGHGLAGLIALGHPERIVTKLRRRAVEEFAAFDRFDGSPFLPAET